MRRPIRLYVIETIDERECDEFAFMDSPLAMPRTYDSSLSRPGRICHRCHAYVAGKGIEPCHQCGSAK
jgi:hypothetical protein